MSSAAIFAGIGAATAIAGTIYSISQSQAAIDAANSVKPPKFKPIDIGQANKLVEQTNRNFVDAAEADWRNRYPLLAEGRDYMVEDANKQLQGDTSKQDAVLKAAGLNVDVGGNQFQQARNLGLPILAKQNRDRAYVQNLLAKNPEQWVGGLTGPESAQIAALNTNSQYNFDLGMFGQRLNAFNAGVANQAQAVAGGINALTGIGQIAANLYQPNNLSNYLNSDYYYSNRPTLDPNKYGYNSTSTLGG